MADQIMAGAVGDLAPLDAQPGKGVPTVHVISDALGETGMDVALAAAAQFDPGLVHLERLPKVSDIGMVERYLANHADQVAERRMTVFYTIADRTLRNEVSDLLERAGIPGVSILGPALDAIQQLTGVEPRGQAGMIHRTDARYFKRIEAMEFFVEHDDGRNSEDVKKADIVLIGVSRTSKTPLSMYLSFHGFKVANIPLAKGVTPPPELAEVDSWRIFGLLSTPEVLSTIRNERLGSARSVAGQYADPLYIQDELDEARALMRKLGCIVIHTDGRAVEETAQIIRDYFEKAEKVYGRSDETV